MITSVNKILTEWAFRTKDGLPNPKSMAHQILLEGILKNYGWSMEARAELLNNLVEANADVVEPTLTKARKKADKGQTYSSPRSKKVYTRGKEEEEGEDSKEDEKTKETKKTTYDKVANNIDSIAQTTPENKKKIKSLMGKALSGKKLEDEESKFLSKWVRVVEPTDATETSNPKYKIYVSRFEGDFRRTTGKGKKALLKAIKNYYE